MNCQDARELFSLLLDGDIALTERVPVEVHLRSCAACRQELEILRTKEPERPAAARPRLSVDLTALHRLHLRWPRLTFDLAFLRRLPAYRPRFTFDFALPRLPIRWPHFAVEGAPHHSPHRRPSKITLGLAWLRRLVMRPVPPGLLAAAVLAVLAAALAIFSFERGAYLATAWRRVVPSAPTGGVAHQTPPPAAFTEPVARPPSQPEAPPAVPAAPPLPPASEPAPEVKRRPPAPPPVETVAPRSVQHPPPAVREVRPAPVARKDTPPVQTVRKNGESKSLAGAVAEGLQARMDVIGLLQVKSRSGAERELAAVLARSGATTLSRQRGQKSTVVAASVPRAGYGTFAKGLGHLGSWQVEAARSPLPDPVRVTVRVAE